MSAAEAQAVAEITDTVEALTLQLNQVLQAGMFPGLADESVLTLTQAIETLARPVDALRVAAAGEISARSRPSLGEDRLSRKKGCRTGNELLARLTLAAERTCAVRARLGEALRARTTLAGQQMPAVFPHVADALAQGVLPVDSAQAIVTELTPTHGNARVEEIQVAEQALVASATGTDPDTPVAFTADQVRISATVWKSVLDADGIQTREEIAMTRRGLHRIGVRDGLVHYKLALIPEIAAKFDTLTTAYRNPRNRVPSFLPPHGNHDGTDDQGPSQGPAHNKGAHGDGNRIDTANRDDRHRRNNDHQMKSEADSGALSDDGALGNDGALGGDAVPVSEVPINSDRIRDERTSAQQLHDILAAILDAAARCADSPELVGASPTVMVTVRAEDLTTGHGVGWIDGLEEPISMRAVKQFTCTGGTQTATITSKGRLIKLGSPERCFPTALRRAVMARDGGCIIPGCHVPAAWCEIHHVTPDHQGGPTHTDNGVAVCWFHHRTIDTSGWEITMIGGAPHVKAPPWIEPPGLHGKHQRPWRPATKSRTMATRRLDVAQRTPHAEPPPPALCAPQRVTTRWRQHERRARRRGEY